MSQRNVCYIVFSSRHRAQIDCTTSQTVHFHCWLQTLPLRGVLFHPASEKEMVRDHNKKGDVWVVLYGRFLNVSNLLSLHPGGKWAILTFGGKDAAADFGMIHPLDVVEKYAPDAIFGVLGRDKPKKAN